MRALRKLHRWLGLIVFIQLLIWTGSGFLISLLDMETAAGATTRSTPVPPPALSASAVRDMETLAIEREGLQSIRLAAVDGAPVYRVQYAAGVRLLDAATGSALQIDADGAERIARASYAGSAPVIDVARMENPAELVNFEGAAWRVQFDDELGTRAYVDVEDGRLLGHRNERSALLDFLLMLHFMDYDGGHDFNHPLIIGFGFVALWLAVSGALLLVGSLRRVGLR